MNVGIFGEGTDSPSLSSVAFLEPRKSSIDVVQAVGRAMRTAPDKNIGYIICPIPFPRNVDPEFWLSTSDSGEGWEILGQVLRALRAHDPRIEDELAKFLSFSFPPQPEQESTLVALPNPDTKEIEFGVFVGPVGHAKDLVELSLQKDKGLKSRKIRRLDDNYEILSLGNPVYILTGKKHVDGSIDLREDLVVRDKPESGEDVGPINLEKTKNKAMRMINHNQGIPAVDRRSTRDKQLGQTGRIQLTLLDHLCEEYGKAIHVNLLAKSGIAKNGAERDANLVEEGIREASRHLREDGLQRVLDCHFGHDQLNDKSRKSHSDGCVIASLLMMNAAMLHQRISNDQWLPDIPNLSELKNSPNVVENLERAWWRITMHDFRPVMEPALDCIEVIRKTEKIAGLERTLHHIACEAEHLAEVYADLGSDHMGALFNRVRGNQASDGAYFTRPPAAALAARLVLDAVGGNVDWRNSSTWRNLKTVDLACGSGTLLSAMLTEMVRRARENGATEKELLDLHRIGVEDTIKGLDIDSVSLQLAAAHLTRGNRRTRYKRMGLHLMPHGPGLTDSVHIGSLELILQRKILPRAAEIFADKALKSEQVWIDRDEPKIGDAVDAVIDAQIVIINPPFTNRNNMGGKFPKRIQDKLRKKTDSVQKILVRNDPQLHGALHKNSIGPLFEALAERCNDPNQGTLAMILPTIALSSTSNLKIRQLFASRYHIHTIVSSYEPGQWNLSEDTGINESLVICKRMNGEKSPTRFIHLDRMPTNESQVNDFHQCLMHSTEGIIPRGWGVIAEWPEDRIKCGDWTLAIWRSHELANWSTWFTERQELITLEALNAVPHDTGRDLRGKYIDSYSDESGSIPILHSKGSEGQFRIQSKPDKYRILKESNDSGGVFERVKQHKILDKAGYLLITSGQNNSTGRLTATAGGQKYVGNYWMPVTGLSANEAKAAAVFLNSTPGRLLIMREPGKNLIFPSYSVASAMRIMIPNVRDTRIQKILLDCWEITKNITVSQFRDGECNVRKLWDDSVADAMHWNREDLSRLRNLLHMEPHVRGLGRNQYKV